MCRDLKLKLIPVIIIVAALFSGLIIYQNTTNGLFILFAAALGVSFIILIATSILSAICGFKRTHSETCHEHSSLTCFILSCLGPTVLITALISVIISLLVIEGAFAAFSGLINAILGIVFALIFSTMLVFFTSTFLTILDNND